jgi:hypothetical protein
MSSLVKAQPSAVRHLTDSTLFYFGSPTIDIHQLPGASKFEIVYSPRHPHGWEYVEYQLFRDQNGIAVLGRRPLQAEEIAYFEELLVSLKRHSSSLYQFGTASV